jgi:hypothetical protein
MTSLNKKFRIYRVISIMFWSLIVTSLAQSQGVGDPIGRLTKTSTFDRAQHVNVGKSTKGNVVCFFEEEGDTNTLYIGISAYGAFIRDESSDTLTNPSNFNPALPLVTRTNPKPPVRVFAAKGLTKLVDGDEKSTGEYEPLQMYNGPVDYVPNIDSVYGGGFILVTKGDAKSFFEMIVNARREFIVVQSISEPKNLDGTAVSDNFKMSTVAALLSCAKKYIHKPSV